VHPHLELFPAPREVPESGGTTNAAPASLTQVTPTQVAPSPAHLQLLGSLGSHQPGEPLAGETQTRLGQLQTSVPHVVP
jgi:hypothetical protein